MNDQLAGAVSSMLSLTPGATAAPVATGSPQAAAPGGVMPFGAVLDSHAVDTSLVAEGEGGQSLPPEGVLLPADVANVRDELKGDLPTDVEAVSLGVAQTEAQLASGQKALQMMVTDLNGAAETGNDEMAPGVIIRRQWDGAVPVNTALDTQPAEVVALMQDLASGRGESILPDALREQLQGAVAPVPTDPSMPLGAYDRAPDTALNNPVNNLTIEGSAAATDTVSLPGAVAAAHLAATPAASAESIAPDAAVNGAVAQSNESNESAAVVQAVPAADMTAAVNAQAVQEGAKAAVVTVTSTQVGAQVSVAAATTADAQRITQQQTAAVQAAGADIETPPTELADELSLSGRDNAKADARNSTLNPSDRIVPTNGGMQPPVPEQTDLRMARGATMDTATADLNGTRSERGLDAALSALSRADQGSSEVKNSLGTPQNLSGPDAARMAPADAQMSMAGRGPIGSQQWRNALSERIMVMTAQGNQVAEIQLDPPELGSLKVRLQVGQDQVSVSFSSPHASVRDAVEQSMPRLREMMEEQGLNLGESSVSDQSDDSPSDEQEGQQTFAGDSDSGASVSEAETVIVDGEAVSLVDYYA